MSISYAYEIIFLNCSVETIGCFGRCVIGKKREYPLTLEKLFSLTISEKELVE